MLRALSLRDSSFCFHQIFTTARMIRVLAEAVALIRAVTVQDWERTNAVVEYIMVGGWRRVYFDRL